MFESCGRCHTIDRVMRSQYDAEARPRQADYLASINLSSGKREYDLKTFPRPTGRATQVTLWREKAAERLEKRLFASSMYTARVSSTISSAAMAIHSGQAKLDARVFMRWWWAILAAVVAVVAVVARVVVVRRGSSWKRLVPN